MDKAIIQEVIEWDIKTWSRALPFWEKHAFDLKGKKVLTLGERHGGLSLWFTLKGAEVTATDLTGVTEKALELHKRHQVQAQVNYAQADMCSLPFKADTFEVVSFKSVLGALGDKAKQQKALDEAFRVLKPGGQLIFAENLVGTSLHRIIRNKFVRWSAYWRYLDPKKDRDLFHQFSQFETENRGFLAVFGRSEGQRRFLGAIDCVLVPLIPQSKRYVQFGVATKK